MLRVYSKAPTSADVLWFVCLLAQVGVIAALPVLPTTDGPTHLYYADVIRGLLNHQHPYADWFKLKSTIPPYLFHYASLILIEQFFEPIAAERFLFCFYAIWLSVAVRYLSRMIGPGWRETSIIALPFTFSFTLMMGFVNFCFGVATTIFLTGYWIKNHDQMTTGRVVTFALLFALLVSMHPVPVAILLGLIGIHTLRQFVRHFEGTSGRVVRRAVLSLISVKVVALPVALCVPFAIWILLLGKQTNLEPTIYQSVPFAKHLEALFLFSEMFGFRARLYRAAPLVLISLLLVIALWQHRRTTAKRDSDGAATLLWMSGLSALAYLVVPDWLGGSAHVQVRFLVTCFFFLLPLTARVEANAPTRNAILAGATAITVAMTVHMFRITRSVDDQILPLLKAPLVPRGSRGLVVSAGNQDCTECRFDPFLGAATYYMLRAAAIQMNFSWIDVAVIPLAIRDPRMVVTTSTDLTERDPAELAARLDFLLILDDRANEPTSFTARLERKYQLQRLTLHSSRYVLLAVPGRISWPTSSSE